MSLPAIALTIAAVAASVALSGCREGRPAASELSGALAMPVRVAPPCESESLRPSTAAPAEGLWLTDRLSPARVAVMVGPARSTAGDARVTRRIESVEVRGQSDTLRRVSDEAMVRLELLPSLEDAALGSAPGTPATDGQPAAVYMLAGGIVVAAYEPCATSVRTPRLRYLRRDSRGRVVIDVLLQRASGG